MTFFSALAQASLPISHAPLSYGVARNNISTARGPPHMPSSPDSIPSPHPPSPRSMSHPYSPQSPSVSSPTADAESSLLPELHPYANPSLAVSPSEEPDPTTPLHPTFSVPGPSQSTSTLSLSRSTTTMSTLSKLLGSERHASPHGREQTLGRISTLNGKEISSPISVLRSPFRDNNSGHSPLNGHAKWNDPPPSPSLTLISLEEARAKRSRSATVNPIIPSRSKDLSKYGTQYEQEPDARTPKFGLSRQNSNSSRTRMRSISTGAKAALHTLVTGSTANKNDSDRSQDEYPIPSAPNGAPLEKPRVRHKKSGIMRLFNSKDKDREKDKDLTPPIPVYPEVYGTHNLSPPQKTSVLQPLKKPSPHRVPVPNVTTLPVPGSYYPQPNHTSDSDSILDISSAFKRPSMITPPATKRTPPRQLSINTSQPRSFMSASSIDFAQSPYDSPGSRSLTDLGSGWLPTQSAPPNAKDFKLSLRPVSGMFSSHFAGHLISPPSASTLASDESFMPLASPEDNSIPITPMSSTRSIHSRYADSSSPEDPNAVISALQTQIVNAKKAWQREIWELECQVRDLKAEVEYLRDDDHGHGYCGTCGRGKRSAVVAQEVDTSDAMKNSIVNRPRARTGTGTTRFAGGV
jgi:hypothetical protein